MLIGGIGKIVVTVLAFSIIVSDAISVFSIGENIGVFVPIEVGLVCII
jgi:hypothetical protein